MTMPMDLQNLEEKAAWVVARAQTRGATTAVADIHQKSEFDIEVRNDEVENLSEAESYGIVLTISMDHRRARVTSCDLSKDSLTQLVEHAVALCNYTDRDDFYSLPDRELLAKEPGDLDLYDPQVNAIKIEDKIAMALDLERQLRGLDPRLKPDGSSLTSIVAGSVLANSLGFCMSSLSGMIGQGCSVFAEDQITEGDLNVGRKQIGHWYARSRHLADMVPASEIAQLAAQQVLRKLGARKPRTGKFPVYFEPNIARTVWQHLLKAASGTPIFRKESYLAERLGTPVCSPIVQIIDDPSIPRGLRSRVFDDEGVACKPLTLVENGELLSYLMSTYSANKLNFKSTGHAGGTNNVLIKPGDMDEAAMIKAMGTGVWVTGMLGKGFNQASGDYSRGATGLWVENGEIAYPISEFTLAGNLDQMLQNIVMLGNNVYHGANIQTPGFVVGEMTVSGA